MNLPRNLFKLHQKGLHNPNQIKSSENLWLTLIFWGEKKTETIEALGYPNIFYVIYVMVKY